MEHAMPRDTGLDSHNSIRANSIRLLAIVASCGMALPVFAQTESAPQSQTQPATQSPSDNPLAGPAVESVTTLTLVKRDFEGKLERIEARPEAAAAELLTLTPDQRAMVNEVLERRSADVVKLTEENYELFLKLQGARQGGDRKEMTTLMRDFRGVAEPLLKPSLFHQVRDVLPPEQRAEFARLVDEYLEALAAEPDPMGMGMQRGQRRGSTDAKRNGDASPDPMSDADTRMGDGPKEGARSGAASGAPSGALARRRVEMNLLIREMARGFGEMVEERREHTDELLKAIGATEEQEARIRAIIRENGETAALKPSEEQKSERFRKIMNELRPEQRRALMDWQRGRRVEPKSD
jgi:Spy/CpxP family protein refolding chaperone